MAKTAKSKNGHTATTIGDLLARDLGRPIEEVVKLDQRDERTVHDEIAEYVATDRIKRQYVDVLQAIAGGPGAPDERTAVWISGFFGSGKSSFAKNLGYILANRELMGTPAGRLFIQRLKEQEPGDQAVDKIANFIEFINARIPTHVIMFDVQVDRAVRRADETIAEIMYTVLLRELDYAQDYDVAALEIELEREGRLADFVVACAELFRDQVGEVEPAESVPITLEGVSGGNYAIWARVRKGAQKIQRASATMHKIAQGTFPNEESWAQSIGDGADISIRDLVDRTFDLVARRKPGHTVVFVIDEVGQYVARSADKIENLRKLVEHFGQESKNRVLKGLAAAPVWVVVTSQEKLDEVVAAIGDKRVEIAKMQDRFHYRIDLAPADIREVATKRVLPKTQEGAALLHDLFRKHAGQLKTHTQAERSQIRFEVTEEEFVQFYPYLPHFVELSIDIVSGLRLQAGAPRHIGGSNRTIIKQTYEMLVSDRTKLSEEPIGTLVTLDRIFDLLEGNLPSETQKDISEILELWPDDPWPARTAKAIVLLEFVRGLPRTEKNLGAVLYRGLDEGSPLPEVERAIGLLVERQFVRQTDDGWKLQTKLEKDWTHERNSFNPSPKERNDILEEQLRTIFEEPGLNRFTRQGRNFRVNVSWGGRTIVGGKGQIPVELAVADGPDRFESACDDVRVRSREEKNTVFWVLSSSDEIDDLVAEVYRSQSMVTKYDQLRAQGKITPAETSSHSSEKLAKLRLEERLKNGILAAVRQGTGFFEGVAKHGSDLGKSEAEIFRAMMDFALPKLYPKLDMGNVPIKGTEAEEILKAANLNGLSQVFYEGEVGLALVIQEGGKYVANGDAPISREIMGYMQSEHSYGNKVSGRMLEDKFGGLGYGWDRDVVALVLATLLRAGAVEVTYQGRKFRNHLDAQVRAAFSGTNAFRSVSFAPREAISLQVLVAAVKRLEELTGEEVDVDESSIAKAFQELARQELEALIPVEAVARAHDVPVLGTLGEYRLTVQGILHSASDDVVRMLAGEGESFKQARKQAAEIRSALSESGLARLRRYHQALESMWPALAAREDTSELEAEVGDARDLLQGPDCFKHLDTIEAAVLRVESGYRAMYEVLHQRRSKVFKEALEAVRGMSEWAALVAATDSEAVLTPLASRACGDFTDDGSPIFELPPRAVACQNCAANLTVLESDIKAVGTIRNEVVAQVQKLAAPKEQIERVRLAEVAGAYQVLRTQEDVKEVIDVLREYLLKLIASGAKVIVE